MSKVDLILILQQVSEGVRAFCEDGRDFIRNVFARVYDTPFPAYTGPKLSKTALRKLQKQPTCDKPSSNSTPSEANLPRNKIDHFVMNLPDTAIMFLDAFRGVLSTKALQEVYSTMPTIHCHCFTRELEPEEAEIDIKQVGHKYMCLCLSLKTIRRTQRVEEKLGGSIDAEIRKVRSVAPGKEMYCISFRLPFEVACNAQD